MIAYYSNKTSRPTSIGTKSETTISKKRGFKTGSVVGEKMLHEMGSHLIFPPYIVIHVP